MATTSIDAVKQHSRNLCAFTGCGRSQYRYPTLHFFSFPVNRPSILGGWLKNCANKALLTSTCKALNRRVVCEKHFEDSCFLSTLKTRLHSCAIPTILSVQDTDDAPRIVQGHKQVDQEHNPVQTNSEQMQEAESEDSVQIVGRLSMEVTDETVIENNDQPLSQDSKVLEDSIQSRDSPQNEPDSVVIGEEVPVDQLPITSTLQHIKRTYSRSKAVSIKPKQGSGQILTGIKIMSKPPAMEKLMNEKLLSSIDAFNKKLLETVPDKYAECEICHLKLINQTALSNHMVDRHPTISCLICKTGHTPHKKHSTHMKTSLPPSLSIEADCTQQTESEDAVRIAGGLFMDLEEETVIENKDQPLSQELKGEISVVSTSMQEEELIIKVKDRPSSEVTAESGWSSNPGVVSKGKPPAVAVRKMILAKQWPYSCSPCNKYFVSDTALEKHMKKHMTTKSHEHLNAMKNKPNCFKLQLTEKNECKSNQVKQCKSSNLTLEESQITGEIELAQFNIGTSDCTHRESEENTKLNEGGKNDLQNLFECEFCQKMFKSEKIYLKHVSNHYTPIRRIMCSICGKHYRCQFDLKKHLRLVCNSGPRICKFCGKSFHTATACRKHTLHHLEMKKKEACKICNKIFQRKYLNQHIKIVHNKYFQCKTCDKQFGLLKLLKDHEAIHSEQKSFKCKVCQRCFFTKERLSRHIIIHSKRFLCKHCGKSFGKANNLVNHERVHERAGSFKCEVCGRSFTLIRSLRNHFMQLHSEKALQCKFCDKRYRTLKLLKSHINTVHHYLVKNVPKPHVCNVCGKDFSFASLLVAHQARHQAGEKHRRERKKTKERGFFCKLCNKPLSSKAGLIQHEKIHTGEKPFHCHLCGKQFRQRASLNTHLIVHSGKRPFVCDICGANYYLKCNLAYHIKLHLKNKP